MSPSAGVMRAFTYDSEDPLTRAMAPPPGETPEERDARLAAEAEARRVSNEIDEALNKERAALKRRKVMKMLLLGQSESGVFISTVLQLLAGLSPILAQGNRLL
jgi:guanine nucleotide-binding protein alpha-1 subunit